ncbi:hypothetical protein [Pseudoalteromonas sp. R3]|uniref:hypothetical protein n=1 Tax=Pseudoalteromonas sp. R3 TaxID=1709477 RepID=UPI0006B64F24|nr:hypothetical protein [Pseudoalteromonas sp. R3]AZZ99510.1 hypothetical protein ELR70_22035 [Pseudoalteromonas sp. R3]
MKTILYAAIANLTLFTNVLLAADYQVNGQFNQSLNIGYDLGSVCSGTAKITSNGLVGNGVEISRYGNIGKNDPCSSSNPAGNHKNRVELASVRPTMNEGSVRWDAFSFKIGKGTTDAVGQYAIMMQYWTNGSGLASGKKAHITLNKEAGNKLFLRFSVAMKCNYPYNGINLAEQFQNSLGEQLCIGHGEERKWYSSDKISVVEDVWYRVRVYTVEDTPLLIKRGQTPYDADTFATGRFAAAVKPVGGSWQAFGFDTPIGHFNYIETFSHEVNTVGLPLNNPSAYPPFTYRFKHHFKFGWYGEAVNGKVGKLTFDEIYSVDGFSQLPREYKY